MADNIFNRDCNQGDPCPTQPKYGPRCNKPLILSKPKVTIDYDNEGKPYNVNWGWAIQCTKENHF